MQAMDTEVNGSTLTRLDDFIVQLLLHLSYYFLNTGRVNTSVADQLVQCQTTGLTAYRVKAADDNGLRRIVNHDLNATGCFQGTDITTFTTDDTALDVVVVNMEHRYGILHGGLSSYTLDGLNDDFLGLGVGIQLGLVHNLVDVSLSIGTGFVLQ